MNKIEFKIIWDGKWYNIELPKFKINFFTENANEILPTAIKLIERKNKIDEGENYNYPIVKSGDWIN